MKDEENDWADWMRAGIAGDRAAYRRLLESLAPFVRQSVRRGLDRYGRGLNDLEDIVQETLLAIHLKRHTWSPDRPIVPWVRAIAQNKTIDTLRRDGYRVNVPIDDLADDLADDTPEPELRTSEIERFVDQVQGRSRDVLRAISIEGLTVSEVAVRLGMSEGAVRVALHRGLKSLAAIHRERDQ